MRVKAGQTGLCFGDKATAILFLCSCSRYLRLHFPCFMSILYLWLLKDNNILTEWDLERKNSCWKLIQWRVRQILTQSSLSVWWWQQCESSDSQTSLPTMAGQRGQHGVLLPPPWSAVDWGECTVSCTLLTVICRTTYRHAGQANVYSKLLLHQYGNVIVPLLLSRQGSYL